MSGTQCSGLLSPHLGAGVLRTGCRPLPAAARPWVSPGPGLGRGTGDRSPWGASGAKRVRARATAACQWSPSGRRRHRLIAAPPPPAPAPRPPIGSAAPGAASGAPAPPPTLCALCLSLARGPGLCLPPPARTPRFSPSQSSRSRPPLRPTPNQGRDRSRRAQRCMPRGGDEFRLRCLGSRDEWRSWRGPCSSKGEPGCAWVFRCLSFPRLALAGEDPTTPVPTPRSVGPAA